MPATRTRSAATTSRRRRRVIPALALACLALVAAACQPDDAQFDAPQVDWSKFARPTTTVPSPTTTVPPTTTSTSAPTTTTTTVPAPQPITTTAWAPDATLNGWNINRYADPSGRTAIRYDWVGKASFKVKVPNDTDALSVVVKGDQCDGAPAFTLTVDGLAIANDSAASSDWSVKTYGRSLLAGTHTVDVEYTNDHQPLFPQTCNRNLYLDSVRFTANPSSALQVVTNSAIPTTGYVHTSGTQLLDGANRPLELRGVNLGGWLLWEGWMWGQGFDYVGQTEMMKNLTSLVGPEQANQFQRDVFDNYITGDDFRAMAHYGINVARVPFNYRMLEDDSNPGVYKQAGWDVLDRIVAEARANNVYLVFDMHAAPCSQSLSFISDWNGSGYLWLSQGCQDRATNLWKAIAARYASEQIVAGYDLLNETVTGEQQLLTWYQRTTAAIRQVDRNHTIIYEGNNLAREFDFLPTGLDSNMMLSLHDYPWMIMGEDLSVRMPRYIAASTRLNAPMWVGEFGQSSYADVERYIDTFDQSPTFVGFAQWSWKQVPGAATYQNIQQTPASKKLVEWMTIPSRPKPTPTEAQQGMADWIDAVRFANTVPDATSQVIVKGG